jgi:fluoroquinolone transport system permease protein
MTALKAVRAIRALGPVDVMSIRRDPMLKYVLLFPIPMILVLRYGLPLLQVRLWQLFAFDISPYYMLTMSFMTLVMPLLIGAVVGFLLLDQRDDQTLLALQVTPLSLNGYLVYRISMPMALSILTSIGVVKGAGLVEIGWAEVGLASLAAAPMAPLGALFLASFARNKVQGFALSKGSSVFMMPPLMAYFVEPAWQWAFGIMPTFWPVRSFWALQAGEPQAWVYLMIGTAYQVLLLRLLVRRFNRITHE